MLSHYIALVVGTMLGIAIMCLVSGNNERCSLNLIITCLLYNTVVGR